MTLWSPCCPAELPQQHLAWLCWPQDSSAHSQVWWFGPASAACQTWQYFCGQDCAGGGGVTASFAVKSPLQTNSCGAPAAFGLALLAAGQFSTLTGAAGGLTKWFNRMAYVVYGDC